MPLTEDQKSAWDASVAAASTAYTEGGDEDVQADEDAREALSAESHTPVINEELGLHTVDEKIQTVDDNPTEMGQLVKDAADAGDLYVTGGPTDDWTGDLSDLSDGVDGLWLAERSKQTGEKYF